MDKITLIAVLTDFEETYEIRTDTDKPVEKTVET